jgi:NADH-quinone oxidoreductase B subunit
MNSSWLVSRLQDVLRWSSSQSLWYYSVNTGCCADEVINAWGCQYDLERFGCIPQLEPAQSDLLMVSGIVSAKLKPHLLELYEQMLAPKYVMALGSCANQGGLFSRSLTGADSFSVGEILPVDVFVPGCPPRPEAIMNGVIALQERIRGNSKTVSTASA